MSKQLKNEVQWICSGIARKICYTNQKCEHKISHERVWSCGAAPCIHQLPPSIPATERLKMLTPIAECGYHRIINETDSQ